MTGRLRDALSGSTLALAFAFAFAFGGTAGCSDSEGGQDTTSGGDSGGDSGSTLITCTTNADCDDGDVCTVDTCAASGVCTYEARLGDRPNGAACEKDCDCEGGVCYDEAYLSPLRFCTKPCGGVSEGCGEYGACLNFSGSLARENGMTLANFCMPRCKDASECTPINPALTDCPRSFTEWKGKTVGAQTCTIIEE